MIPPSFTEIGGSSSIAFSIKSRTSVSSSRFSSNLNVFFFICQLIINTLFFSTMYRYRKNIPLWLSMLSYLTLYYCRTFNYLRQSFSLAIIFFSLRYLEKEKPISFFIVHRSFLLVQI